MSLPGLVDLKLSSQEQLSGLSGDDFPECIKRFAGHESFTGRRLGRQAEKGEVAILHSLCGQLVVRVDADDLAYGP
jgi:hypothetical protein